METSNLPFVSIIIPVYEDAERLGLCLDALNQQTYPRTRFEIIVIDNGSTTLDLVKSVVERHNVDIFDVEITPGSYAARNRGIDRAKGAVIAFTDSDCIPEQDWLEKGVDCLMSRSLDMVTGGIEVFPKDQDSPNLFERYQMATAFPQERYMKQSQGGATANAMVCKKVISKVGKFNTTLKSGGDLEWGRRVFQAGFRQQYVAEAKVYHPARDTWIDLSGKTIRTTGGHYEQLVKSKKTLWYRNVILALVILADLKYVFDETLFNPRVLGLKHGLEVFGVTLCLQCLRIRERIRLHMGGVSRRV